MKAKFKPLIILIAVFVVSLVAGVVAGCSVGQKSYVDIANEKGLTCPVTYYANGGRFKSGTDNMPNCYLTVYYKPESTILNLGVMEASSGDKAIDIYRDNYLFLGWRYCLLDEDGNPVLTDMDGNPLKYLSNGTADITETKDDREVQKAERAKQFMAEIDPDKGEVFAEQNSKVQIHEGQHLFLVADWAKDVEVKYVLDIGEDQNMTVEIDGKEEEWENGRVIGSKLFGDSESISLTPKDVPVSGVTFKTHTYISLYFEENGVKVPIVLGKNSRVSKPESGDVMVYVKFLKGTDWVPVRSDSDVKKMISYDGSEGLKRYYIVNDIDCEGTSIQSRNNSSAYMANIVGNGYTISNISISEITLRNGPLSLFGMLDPSAAIKDLTLKNVTFNTVTIALGSSVDVYAFISNVNGADIENFKVAGKVEVNIKRNGTADQKKIAINNMQEVSDGEFVIEPWLIGSLSDDEFRSGYGGENLELVISIDNKIVHGGQE